MKKNKETLIKKQRKNELKKFIKDSQQKPVSEWTWNGKYSADDYRTTFFLHDDHEKWSPEHIFRSCIVAIYLVKCLQASGYFGSYLPNKEDLKYVAGLTLRYLNICYVNVTAVANFQDKGLGSAIFPSTSLMNHSCVRNTVSYTLGRIAIVRAAENIKKGDTQSHCSLNSHLKYIKEIML